MKYLSLLFILNCFLNYLWSQDLPLDFENNQDLFTAFGNCEFYIQQDPTNNSNMVGVIQNSGSNLYEGIYLDLTPAANFDSSNIIRFDFFSDNGQNNTIQVKFEGSDSGFGDAFLEATIPGNGWSNVELDFSQSNIIGESGTENINGNFSRIAIFVGPNQLLSGTFLIDNVEGGENLSLNFNNGFPKPIEKYVTSALNIHAKR